MRQLAHQELDVPLARLALADVAVDRGDADHPAGVVVHGGDVHGHVEQPAVLVTAHHVGIDGRAGSDIGIELRERLAGVVGREDAYRSADGVARRIAEEARGGGVPGADDAVRRKADDGAGRGGDDGCQMRLRAHSGVELLGSVAQHEGELVRLPQRRGDRRHRLALAERGASPHQPADRLGHQPGNAISQKQRQRQRHEAGPEKHRPRLPQLPLDHRQFRPGRYTPTGQVRDMKGVVRALAVGVGGRDHALGPVPVLAQRGFGRRSAHKLLGHAACAPC